MATKRGNSENLKGHGFDERTAEEQREIAKKGGIASGVARRKKRDWKAKAQAMLSTPVSKDMAKKLAVLGVDEDDADWDDLILAALIKKAANGSVMAITALAGITGNDQYLKVKQAELRVKQAELREKKREYDADLALKREEFEQRKKEAETKTMSDAEDWGAIVEQAFDYDAAREDQ